MQPPKSFPAKNGKVKFDIDNDVIASDIRGTVAEVGEKLGLEVIDLYEFTEDHPEWFADGVHPNAEGNYSIAMYISTWLV